MSSDGSDIEIHSRLPKKAKKKPPESPTEKLLKKNEAIKKLSTNDMIHQALTESKSRSRKGISLYAIKKYLKEKFNADTEKINYRIKKSLKTGVETGTYVQTKGIGASGSFKLAPQNKTTKKVDDKQKPKEKVTTAKEEKTKTVKTKKSGEEKGEKKAVKSVTIAKTSKTIDKDAKKAKMMRIKAKLLEPTASARMDTPKKRSNMMKRKSIGSIIKPPKMKPRPPAR